jgi:hypothetical protein
VCPFIRSIYKNLTKKPPDSVRCHIKLSESSVKLTSISLSTNCNHVVHLTKVNSTNVQDEGLRIRGIGRRMNSNVKVSQTRPVLAPIYRWPGQGPIYITMFVYDMDSYFDYEYSWA